MLEMPLILAKLGDRTVFGSTTPSFCTLVEEKNNLKEEQHNKDSTVPLNRDNRGKHL